MDMNLRERLLKRVPIFRASRIVEPRIGIQRIRLLNVGIVIIVNTDQAQGPLDRLKSSFSFEQLDCEGKIVGKKVLFTAAKELGAIWPRATNATWSWQLPRLELKKVTQSQIEKDVFPDDWHIPL